MSLWDEVESAVTSVQNTLTSNRIPKVRGYSTVQPSHMWEQNNNTKAKNKAVYNIHHILAWNMQGLSVLCKLHCLECRDCNNLCIHHGGLQRG